jgi:CRISPR-associated protein Cas5h
LVAAILGKDRNEYHDLFARGESAIAIEPLCELRTMQMPINSLTTSDKGIKKVKGGSPSVSIGIMDSSVERQQYNYEVLVDPAYRIDLVLSDTEVQNKLQDYLSAGKSYYPPSLGLSEYLASVEYLGEHEITEGPSDVTYVDSAIPEAGNNVIPEPHVQRSIENSPGWMEKHSGGRRTTGFLSMTYNTQGGQLKLSGVQTHQVDGRTVLFS